MSLGRSGLARLAGAFLPFLACNSLLGNELGAPPPDAAADADGTRDARDGASPESGADEGGSATDAPSSLGDAPSPRGDGGPAAACRPLSLPCLDPAPATVRDVPGETTAADAFASAMAGDTIQIHGPLDLGSGWKVPPYVTLRGCAGAKIGGTISFQGSGGTIEGFEVAGGIVANQTGDYVVRSNRFVASTDPSLFAVSARSIDALVSATVTATVDSNLFVARASGVAADTQYDTMTHEVTMTVRNNVFSGVARPIRVSEGGLVGKITPLVEQNTFYKFDTAISLYAVKRLSTLRGNLFSQGTTAVVANSAFAVSGSMIWQVTNATTQSPPTSGTFAMADPAFADPGADDFTLRPGSPAIDVLPNDGTLPALDYFGCPRPVGVKSAEPKGDIGALEAQR
jgi:hypothetical protein